MPLIDAALAFCLTMLLVSTIVSQIVTLILGLFKFRRKQLVKMLQDYSTQELVPVLQRELARLKANATDIAEEELTELENKLKAYGKKPAEIVNLLASKFPETEGSINKFTANVTEVSKEDLLERLKETSLGEELQAALGDRADKVIDELGQRYDAIGARFTSLYRGHTRACTTVVAFLLAAAVNIDSIQLINAYIDNPNLSAETIAQTDSIVNDYHATAKKLEAATGSDASSTNNASLDAVKAEFGQLKTSIDNLNDSGLPIGPDYRAGGSKYSGSEALNIFGIILTGLLAGLGAPFWYDAIKGLSSLARGRSPEAPPSNPKDSDNS